MRKLIRTDGTSAEFDRPLTLDQIGELIGACVFDSVILRHLGEPLHVMLVNDAGYEVEQVTLAPGVFENRCVKARLPDNAEATALYHRECYSGTTHRIVGHVFVCPDSDFGGPV